MATIVHILVSLVVAILRGFASALVMLFSRAALGVVAGIALVAIVLGLAGTLGISLRRRG